MNGSCQSYKIRILKTLVLPNYKLSNESWYSIVNWNLDSLASVKLVNKKSYLNKIYPLCILAHNYNDKFAVIFILLSSYLNTIKWIWINLAYY